MAEGHVTLTEQAAVAVAEDRLNTAREAVWQIDAMLDMLNRERQRHDECFDITLAACMPRLKQLVGVAMDVTAQEQGRSIEELREVVYG